MAKVSEKPLFAGQIANDDEIYLLKKDQPAANQSQRTKFSTVRSSLGILNAEDLNVGDIVRVQEVDGKKVFVNEPFDPQQIDPNIVYVKNGDDISALALTLEPGKMLDVGPGFYDMGGNRFILMDGVSYRFAPGVIISGGNATGTVTDNNMAVVCYWYGEPGLINTTDAGRALYLQNPISTVLLDHGYYEFIGRIAFNGTTIIIAGIRNTFPGASIGDTTKNGTGDYTVEFNYTFKNVSAPIRDRMFVVFSGATLQPIGYCRVATVPGQNTITINTYDLSGNFTDLNSGVSTQEIYFREVF